MLSLAHTVEHPGYSEEAGLVERREAAKSSEHSPAIGTEEGGLVSRSSEIRRESLVHWEIRFVSADWGMPDVWTYSLSQYILRSEACRPLAGARVQEATPPTP